MPLIKNKQKARQFIDAIDESLSMRRTRNAEGGHEIEIVITEALDDLTALVEEAAKHGLQVRYDGARLLVEEPSEGGLPTEVTEVTPL
jgi:hypothetical protein